MLERAPRAGSLDFTGSTRAQARLVIASRQGAVLVARSYGDAAGFEQRYDVHVEGDRALFDLEAAGAQIRIFADMLKSMMPAGE